MWYDVAWYTGLLGPAGVGMAVLCFSTRSHLERLRSGIVGSLLAVAIGAASSFVAGQAIMSAVTGAGDIPAYLFMEAWHRMWYPLALGLVVAVAIAFQALRSSRPDHHPPI